MAKTQKQIEKLNTILANSFTNLRNDILRINQRIDQIELFLASSNIAAMKEFMAAQERDMMEIKQFLADRLSNTAVVAAEQNPQQPEMVPGVRIVSVQFEAEGSERENLNGEWVELEGQGMDMSGWMLCDKDNKHVYTFPNNFVINGKVRLHTGKGRNSSKKLHWGSSTPIWNNEDDVATLFDPEGRVMSQVRSSRVHNFEILV